MSAVLPSPLGGGGRGGGGDGFSAFPLGTGLTPLDVRGGGWGRDEVAGTTSNAGGSGVKRKGSEDGGVEEKKVKT